MVPNRAGSIYVLGIEGSPLLKIGATTKDPQARLRDLQVGLPYRLILLQVYPCHEALRIEKRLHALLRDKRYQGEWFEVDPEAIAPLFRRALTCTDEPNTARKPAPRGQERPRKPVSSPNANYATGHNKTFGDTVQVNELWGMDPDDLPQVGDYVLLATRAHELTWVRPSRSKRDTIRYRAIIRRLDEVPPTARTFDSASNLSFCEGL